MKRRCAWAANGGPFDQRYHDREWGVPVHSDRKLFEFLILEGAQAGLSWSTILRKRGNYRKVYDNFDARKIARYNATKVRRLLKDPGIVRNRLKIRASILNARAFLEIQKEFGRFDRYIWQFTGGIATFCRVSFAVARTGDSSSKNTPSAHEKNGFFICASWPVDDTGNSLAYGH